MYSNFIVDSCIPLISLPQFFFSELCSQSFSPWKFILFIPPCFDAEAPWLNHVSCWYFCNLFLWKLKAEGYDHGSCIFNFRIFSPAVSRTRSPARSTLSTADPLPPNSSLASNVSSTLIHAHAVLLSHAMDEPSL